MRTRHAVGTISTRIVTICLAGVFALWHANDARAQTVVQHDWEDGTTQGWIPRGGSVVLTNTTEAANTGTRSLKTTGRTAGFHGPSLSVLPLLSPGTIYQVTAAVRLVSGDPATQVIITVQRTLTDGTNQFDRVVASAAGGVTDAAWVMLQGQYSFAGSVSALLLYIESPSPTAAYYVDDFSIRVVPALGCADPPDTSGIHTDFETSTTEGWGPRIGNELVAATPADKHSGTFSLLTTGRTAFFQGPAINAAGKLCNGSRYNISVWVKLAPGEPDIQIRVSLQRTLAGVTNFNTVIPNTTVTANDWVRLRVTYDFVFNYNSLTLYVESANPNAPFPSFYIDDFDVAFVPPPVAERNIPSVYQTLAGFFPIGAAVWQGDLSGEHAFLLTKHFNSITSENDMKWSSLQPTEGTFTFAATDAQVALAKASQMAIHGHTLVWHNQVPTWVFTDPAGNPMTPTPENKALLLQRLENYIRTVVSHFGDDVGAWDVVNEVIDPSQSDGFRRSPWFTIIGPEYIDMAFRIAREEAPNARLYVNDFDTTNVVKRGFLLNLIRDLKGRGVPVDGIGHQMHNNIEFPSAQAIIETINLFSALGVDNQVTELDVSIYSGSFPDPFTAYEDIPADRFVRQAFKYRDFFQAFRHLTGKISSVTFWGQADDHTWLTSAARVNAPLLFDTSLTHKLAYLALVDPSQLPGAGSTAGFTGAFRVQLAGPRRTASATFSLSNNGPSGTFEFNFNNPAIRVRFESSAIISYGVSPSGNGHRADFTIAGTRNDEPGYILTGHAIDGGPQGSGMDVLSIAVRTPTGALILSAEGPVSEGDVVITP
jgi:endo-1,4-beta-xylanase